MAVCREAETQPESVVTKRLNQSGARIVHVFHHLVRFPEGQQLSEISKAIGLSEVTTLRLLQTLIHEGVVRKDPERGRYRGAPLFWLTVAAAVPDIGEAQRHLRATMAGLAQRTRATAVLAIPYVGMRLVGVVAAVPPEPSVRLPLAANVPMHAMAAGKCYLSTLPEEALQHWLRGKLPVVTSQTRVDAQALAEEIRQVRAQGYATDVAEHLLGCCGVAVPVTDVTGSIAAMLQLCAPGASVSEATLRQWLPPLQSVARSLADRASAIARLG